MLWPLNASLVVFIYRKKVFHIGQVCVRIGLLLENVSNKDLDVVLVNRACPKKIKTVSKKFMCLCLHVMGLLLTGPYISSRWISIYSVLVIITEMTDASHRVSQGGLTQAHLGMEVGRIWLGLTPGPYVSYLI